MSQSADSDDDADLGTSPGSGFDDADEGFEAEGFEEGDHYDDAMGDEADAFEQFVDEADNASADSGDAFEVGDEADAGDVEAAWSEFEADIADALDAEDTEEFLSSILGGFSRAAGAVARGLGPMAGAAQQGAGVARGVGNVASGLGQLANSASLAARWFGAPRAAAALGRFGRGARRVGGVAGSVGNALGQVPRAQRAAQQAGQMAQGASQASNPLASILGSLGQLMGSGADEYEAFDAMVDLYAEDGVDEALPAAVGLAARAAARALGWQNVGQLGDAARRALVRGVATAARTLVRQQGPQAVRALPRIAQSTARVARRRKVPRRQLPQTVARSLPRTTQRVASQPQVVRRLSQPMSTASTARTPRGGTAAPLSRPTNLGRGTPTVVRGTARRFRLDGPIELTIRAL